MHMYKGKNATSFSMNIAAESVNHNSGLRKYMLNVYNYMSASLLISGLVAMFAASTGIARAIFSTPLGLIFIFAPMGIAIWMGARFSKMSSRQALMALFLYAAAMGLSLSTIFLTFTTVEIVKAFMTTSIMFLSASIYGYSTKKDLTAIGSFMMMMLIGLVVASLLNLIFKSSISDLLISCAFVVIFTIMTAYDTQKLKDIYHSSNAQRSSENHENKVAVFGAMRLYLDFINIFISLLHIMRGMRGND